MTMLAEVTLEKKYNKLLIFGHQKRLLFFSAIGELWNFFYFILTAQFLPLFSASFFLVQSIHLTIIFQIPNFSIFFHSYNVVDSVFFVVHGYIYIYLFIIGIYFVEL